jgi:hypothetical protein
VGYLEAAGDTGKKNNSFFYFFSFNPNSEVARGLDWIFEFPNHSAVNLEKKLNRQVAPYFAKATNGREGAKEDL